LLLISLPLGIIERGDAAGSSWPLVTPVASAAAGGDALVRHAHLFNSCYGVVAADNGASAPCPVSSWLVFVLIASVLLLAN